MAGDQLRVDPARGALEVALAPLREQQREEVDLEKEVAELVEELGVIALLSRVRDLVGLLDRVGNDRADRLLAVPGTIAAQPLRELFELEQRVEEGLVGRCSLSGCDGRSEGRTQGASIVKTIGATKDAASGRAARSDNSGHVPPRPP